MSDIYLKERNGKKTICCVQHGCHSNQWLTSRKEGVCGGRKLGESNISSVLLTGEQKEITLQRLVSCIS